MPMLKHFVNFYSPGTFISEESTQDIKSWDVQKAMKMADAIAERYNATPYGFRFSTRERKDDDLDSSVTKTSHMYFLGGKIKTLKDIQAENDPSNRILISNMEINNIKRVVVNTNSYKSVLPLEKDDVVLNYTPPKRKESKTDG